MYMTKIAIVTVDYNSGKETHDCLASLEKLKTDDTGISIIVVDPNLLKDFLLVAKTDPKIGLIGAKIYFAKGHEFHKERYTEHESGKVFWYAGGGFDWNNAVSYHRGVDEVDHGQYDTTEETGFVTGCCMFLTRDVLGKTGFLDDNYFLYYEDANLNQRIK